MEKEIKAKRREEKPVGRKYKKRPRRQLTSADIEEIVQAYEKGDQTQVDVARQHRITPCLVS